MATFLIRSLSDPKGYTEIVSSSDQLPRSAEESYVPWALTMADKVVFARYGEHIGWRAGGGKGGPLLKPYDSHASQKRRRLAESELGLLALNQRQFTQEAVGAVSNAIKVYLNKQFWSNQDKTKNTVFKEIGHYFYTGGGTGFGRINESKKESVGVDGVWRGILDALGNGRLDQVLAIHDAVGRKVLPALGGSPLTTYNHWGPILRQDWFDDKDKRGRVNAPAKPTATRIGGIVDSGQSGSVGTVGQARTRGVDSFQRDMTRVREKDADAYYDDVDVRNLLFGAGISGTTGSLLQAAFAFGGLVRGEPLKQYVLAIVGYLVGGGMHSYHESMAVAQKAGLPYTPGAYIPSLPQTFLSSQQFKRWSEQYYDIVQLGATHWRHNATHLPSHLNKELRT
ncbi:hypothetical protein [Methylomonas methanica]|uniref:Uncharacterized protein n=1 Tax=Methylomonas methanica (strain DSM 25384 / MC09) TaxID=857087 RepID=F9ZYZ8_METMM|nr:hypothetical protein [Methylomonas methanica]AEF99853.1 hypothetical protein Metme_1430 [Methylomonas methanica MC09]